MLGFTRSGGRRPIHPCPKARGGEVSRRDYALAETWPHFLAIAVSAFVAWPSIVRPPTDGDTLIYHLPNAASWLYAHSLWVTTTHYWWYPGGSELMTAASVAACGIFALPAVGAVALLALTLAVYEIALDLGCSRSLSIAAALLLTTSRLAIVQGGDMQNDVLLAALIVATASWSNERRPRLLLATLALVKPIGWIDAVAVATVTRRGRAGSLCAAVVAIGLWTLRNAILARSPVYPLPPAVMEDGFTLSPIIVHGITGLTTLASACAADGTSTVVLAACGLVAWLPGLPPALRRLAFVSILIWFSTPYSFESTHHPELANGLSLRFGLPTLALGAVALARWTQVLAVSRAWVAALVTAGCASLVAKNVAHFAAVFANDGSTYLKWVAGAVVIVVGFLPFGIEQLSRLRIDGRVRSGLGITATVAMLAVGFDRRSLAGVVGYYTDAIGEHGIATSLPATIASTRATTIVTDGYPTGMVAVLRPDVRIINFPGGVDACADARSLHGVVMLHPRPVDRVRTDPSCIATHPTPLDIVITPSSQ